MTDGTPSGSVASLHGSGCDCLALMRPLSRLLGPIAFDGPRRRHGKGVPVQCMTCRSWFLLLGQESPRAAILVQTYLQLYGTKSPPLRLCALCGNEDLSLSGPCGVCGAFAVLPAAV